jgi:endonuclease/exonuclease/phosphatase family metal-dependent hydrolase
MNLTVATYNIHSCIGRDRRFDPERIVRVLKELDAEVIALQEVPLLREGGSALSDCIAALMPHAFIAGRTLIRGTGHYGNALLTTFPARAVRLLDLSVSRREPRGAIDADLHAGERMLRVVNTHLGLRAGERRRQLRMLLQSFADAEQPAVFMGDINEWGSWARVLRGLNDHFCSMPAPRTYPASLPLLRLDRIWVARSTCVVKLYAHASALARTASDHLPLRAVLSI